MNPKNIHDFAPGDRVRYKSHPKYKQMASTGIKDLYLHLNARPFITCTVLHRLTGHMGEYYAIRPDGWPLPPGKGQTLGFTAHRSLLEPWPERGASTPAPLVDGRCHTVSPETVKRLVNEYLKNEGSPHATTQL